MPRKNSTFGGMKTFNINIRVSDELKDNVQFIKKYYDGGITGFIEKKIKEFSKEDYLKKIASEVKNM